MKIEINNFRKILAIQQEFNQLLPNLKLEFHEKPSKLGGPPSEKMVRRSSKIIQECRTSHEAGFITILPGNTVGELKSNFSDIYGLSVEVYHNSGNTNLDRSPVSDNSILESTNNEIIPAYAPRNFSSI